MRRKSAINYVGLDLVVMLIQQVSCHCNVQNRYVLLFWMYRENQSIIGHCEIIWCLFLLLVIVDLLAFWVMLALFNIKKRCIRASRGDANFLVEGLKTNQILTHPFSFPKLELFHSCNAVGPSCSLVSNSGPKIWKWSLGIHRYSTGRSTCVVTEYILDATESWKCNKSFLAFSPVSVSFNKFAFFPLFFCILRLYLI